MLRWTALKFVAAPRKGTVLDPGFFYQKHLPKNTPISNQIPYRKTKIQDGSFARRGGKFEGGPPQHCLDF